LGSVMRTDMFKVIVERPRKHKHGDIEAARRRDAFDGPMQLGMRAGYGYRALNENLSPLRRYLRSQVGRPWDKVFGEICAHIDRRSTVQQHSHQHIEDFIAVQVKRDNGRLFNLRELGSRFWPDKGLRQELYVDPRSGLIRVNEEYRPWNRRRAERAGEHEAAIAARRRVIDAKTMLLKLEAGWFCVDVDSLPAWSTREIVVHGQRRCRRHAEERFDVVLRRKTSIADVDNAELREYWYGHRGVYGVKKRQLSRREMKKYGIETGSEPATAAVRQSRRRSSPGAG